MNLLKNRTVLGVICILLSLLICFGVTPLFNKTVSQKTEIVRVTKEIKAGDEITKDMVQIAEWMRRAIDNRDDLHVLADLKSELGNFLDKL